MRKADRIIMFNVSLKGMPAWLLSGKALYLSHHTALWYENGPRPWQQRLKQWVANYMANKNCACSGYIASLYKSCEVIYSPFRSDVFVPGTAPRIPGSILFAGRLVSDKGADLLLEAFALLQKAPSSPHTHTGSPLKRESEGQPTLTLAGSGPDLPLLEQKVKSLGISRQVHFTGSLLQSELVRLMQTSQIMVVPSRMEPMGMVVAEGLACGCSMVVSNQGGMPEVGGNFCHYFESGNPVALAAALQKAFTNPLPVNAQELEAHLQQFTIKHSVAKLEDWLGFDV
jgi:glycosyltransferase involved in cell wall biosynthesis